MIPHPNGPEPFQAAAWLLALIVSAAVFLSLVRLHARQRKRTQKFGIATAVCLSVTIALVSAVKLLPAGLSGPLRPVFLTLKLYTITHPEILMTVMIVLAVLSSFCLFASRGGRHS